MKIYAILDYYSSGTMKGIHSAYLSKEKAYSISDELRTKGYQKEIQYLMDNEEMNENEATIYAEGHYPRWLYEVEEIEVEE